MRAAIFSMSKVDGDPRPRRFLEYLLSFGAVVDVYCYPCAKASGVNQYNFFPELSNRIVSRAIRLAIMLILSFANEFIPKKEIILKILNFKYNFTSAIGNQNVEYEVVFVEDLYLLPFVTCFFPNSKIVFDAREFYPRQFDNEFLFNILEANLRNNLCQSYLPRCDLILTVSPNIAAEYEKTFNVDVRVFLSAPKYKNFGKRSKQVKKIKLVYHGSAAKNRNISNLIDIVKLLDDRFCLDLYLVGNSTNVLKLKNLAENTKNVCVCDPVPYDEIHSTLCNYDVGFFYVEPVTFNLKYCLPNKFFEFIQAGLAIAIGPSPDMSAIVRQFDIGVVASDFTQTAMFEALSKLNLNDLERFKTNCLVAAKKLNFDNESIFLDNYLRQLETNFEGQNDKSN